MAAEAEKYTATMRHQSRLPGWICRSNVMQFSSMDFRKLAASGDPDFSLFPQSNLQNSNSRPADDKCFVCFGLLVDDALH